MAIRVMTDSATARAQTVEIFLSLMQALNRRQTEDKPWLSLDLTMAQLKTLMIVLQTGGVPSRVLAERLSIGPSAVTPLVDQLVDQKLVTREADVADRRIVFIRPTPRAVSLRRRLLETSRTAVAKLLNEIPTTEIPAIQRALAQLAGAAERVLARKEEAQTR
jgi:DNA-binding MarR family transcriptional regulator